MSPDPRPLRVLVAAGGTAGHLAPALAVADQLRAASCEVAFVASRGRRDEEIVTQAGYDVETFAIGGLPRRPGLAQFMAIVRALTAVFATMRIVRRRRPDVVLAGGGFVSTPVAIAAWLLRIPVVATEADAHLGLANRITSRFSRRLCTAYPLPRRRHLQEVVGRPVSQRFVDLHRAPDGGRREAREQLGLPHDERVLLVFGGSGGATRLNDSTHDAWGGDEDPRVDGVPLHLLHVAGRRDHPQLAALGIASERYRLIDYSDELDQLIAAADLVVCRPGGSVFELAAVGRAALLIPSPNVTADHQTKNARWFETQGAARVGLDSELDAAYLLAAIDELLGQRGDAERAALERGMRSMARPDAAERIAGVVHQCASAHRRRHPDRDEQPQDGDDVSSGPLAGRSFHMLGAGGAGVSALAMVCHAWGAKVSGCDRGDSQFAQLVRGVGIDVHVGHDPAHVESAHVEIVASSALPSDHAELVRARELGCRVWLRGELLGELTRMNDETIIVAGAHGKSTTTGMLAVAATRLGLDPAAALGATIPGLGPDGATNVLTGSGPFLVEGDESDRTLLHLAPRVAVVTNIERDHHHTFATDEELERLFAQWIREQRPDVLVAGPGATIDRVVQATKGSCRVVRFGSDPAEVDSVAARLSLPGRHNALNALAAMRALQATPSGASFSDDELLDALARFEGVGRRFEQRGEVRGVLVVDDYAHHPTEVAATIDAARERARERGGRVLVAFQPHLYSRTEALASEFAEALAAADRAWVLPIYGAREEPIDGVTERLIADQLVERAPMVYAGRGVNDPAAGDPATIAAEAREGDVLLTMGAGDVTLLAQRLLDALDIAAVALPDWVRRDVPLTGISPIATGGVARLLATPETEDQLLRALAWARDNGLRAAIVGVGSRVLVADDGFDGLAIELAGELARIEVDEQRSRVVLGGGAPLATAAERCRDAGLAGLEFACGIDGTAGRALRTNASAHGSSIAEVLLHARLVSASGIRDAVPADLDLRDRRSNIAQSEAVGEVELALSRDDPAAIAERMQQLCPPNRATTASESTRRTLRNVFCAPVEVTADAAASKEAFADGRMLDAGTLVERAGFLGHSIRGARISPVDGNAIENHDTATTADVVAVIDAVRTGVRARFGVLLETDLELLDDGGYRPLHDDDAGHLGIARGH